VAHRALLPQPRPVGGDLVGEEDLAAMARGQGAAELELLRRDGRYVRVMKGY
jgi:hypothetical protein